MRLYVIRDTEPYSYLTVWYDYAEFAAQRGYELRSFDSIHAFLGVVNDPDPCLFIAESATLQRTHLSRIKQCLPNSYVVILGSDTIHHGLDPAKNPEVPGALEHVNLWLDLVSDVVESYRRSGLNAVLWHWTTSEYFVKELDSLTAQGYNVLKGKKSVDLIGLFREDQSYRKWLWEGLRMNGASYIKGGDGVSYEARKLHAAYSSALITLGTTSPSWTNCRTIKGFRDWIGPLCGSMLVYDNHPQIMREYGNLIPFFYDYHKPVDTLTDIVNCVKNSMSAELYSRIVSNQADWVRENTIAKQLLRLLPQTPPEPVCKDHFS